MEQKNELLMACLYIDIFEQKKQKASNQSCQRFVKTKENKLTIVAYNYQRYARKILMRLQVYQINYTCKQQPNPYLLSNFKQQMVEQLKAINFSVNFREIVEFTTRNITQIIINTTKLLQSSNIAEKALVFVIQDKKNNSSIKRYKSINSFIQQKPC
ncbi:unnamed protein product [Paramecium octaurelia]|uniref:Uncharacterized protein n=1 Tax=Paramecium octaurelia TaxID=43137 RepID=A0A8S1X2B5_PAROT|nr:unnamed protein product [Paramecium octaurelia]